MFSAIDEMLEAVEERRLDRREAVMRLGALILAAVGSGGVVAADRRPQSTFRATGLNHIALRVSDVARSRDFYSQHLGLEVIRESGASNCFMSCGPDHFVALFRGSEPGMDHYCYTVQGYRPADVVERLRAAGLQPRRSEDRVYFPDPDGLTVQLSGDRDAWPG